MSPTTLALLPLLTLATNLSAEKDKRQHDYLIAQLRASTLKDMVEALVTRRVEVVGKQCHDILIFYDKQQQSYLLEKEKYTDRIIDCDDPLKRSELISRVNEIDTRLAEIRADARLLFDRMGELLIALGGGGVSSVIGFASDLAAPLGLPNHINVSVKP